MSVSKTDSDFLMGCDTNVFDGTYITARWNALAGAYPETTIHKVAAEAGDADVVQTTPLQTIAWTSDITTFNSMSTPTLTYIDPADLVLTAPTIGVGTVKYEMMDLTTVKRNDGSPNELWPLEQTMAEWSVNWNSDAPTYYHLMHTNDPFDIFHLRMGDTNWTTTDIQISWVGGANAQVKYSIPP